VTEDEIVKSDVFKALNLVIDEEAQMVQSIIAALPGRIEQAFQESKYPSTLDTRVSYESEDGRTRSGLTLAARLNDLEGIGKLIDQAIEGEKKVRELMRFKLRLLNDYDFTHGDASDQIAVFGEKVE